MYATVLIILFGVMASAWCSEIRKFPEGFQFGTATSAYQVEGAWNVSDKAECIWDRATHAGIVGGGSTGDIAADSYHQFRRDVEMLRELGVDFYRFSVSWSRLLPSGFADKVSEDGKRYYTELIDELLKYGIEPMVTIFHWELPQKLQDLGGWTNPLIVDWFEDYARVLYDLFGDKVKTWITINEPLIICNFMYSHLMPIFPTSNPGISEFICAKNLMLAHARAWRLYDEKYKPLYHGEVGLANEDFWLESDPAAPEDELVEQARQLYSGLYAHPVYSARGGWPPAAERVLAARSAQLGYPRSRLPAFTQQEIDFVKGTYDFYGLNYYLSKYVGRSNETIWPILSEIGADLYPDPSWPKTASDKVEYNPVGLRRMLNFIKERYNDPKVIITENGYPALKDPEDDNRCQFIKEYLDQVLDAVHLDGVRVSHYTYWSLMDVFEWSEGYTLGLGLYEVDFSDARRPRRARKSARVYQHILSTRTLDVDYQP